MAGTSGRPLGSRYVLETMLGRGATGEVWRGTDTDGTPLAFKLIHQSLLSDPEVVHRFLQEKSVLTGLDHPHLVRVRDLVAEGNTLAIVMDLVEGGDVRSLLATRRTLPPAEACRIAADVAAALAAVHAAGVIHRDVKPANVLLDAGSDPPMVKLTDFGIAKVTERSTASQSTMLVGTPAYVAPEVIDGRQPTPAADLYGLGVMLYEMCCGVPPYVGESALAVLRQHADYLPGRPPGIPDPLWDVLWSLLAKDPATRLGPAGRVATMLTALSHDLAGAPAPPPLTAPPPPVPGTEAATMVVDPVPHDPGGRRLPRPLLVGLVVLGLVAAGFTGWALADRASTESGTGASTVPSAPAASSADASPTSSRAATAPVTSPVASPTAASTSPGDPDPVANVLPEPPSDPGVPYETGTITADDRHPDVDFERAGRGRSNLRFPHNQDLSLETGGLATQNGALLAPWNGAGTPTPSSCHAMPQSEWLPYLKSEDMKTDDTYCFLTNEGRYGYLEIRDHRINEGGDLRSVTLTVVVWSKSSDL